MGFRKGMSKIWEKMKASWVENMDRDHKKISGGFGMFLIIVITSILTAFAVVSVGGVADWGMAGAEILAGLKAFLILCIGVFFGHKSREKSSDENK